MMALASCSKVNLPEPDENTVRQASVTLLVTPNGIGDNGYNDCIVDGLFRFHEQTGKTVSLLEPSDSAEAMAMYRNWVQSHAEADSAILILGSSVYENIVSQEPPRLAGHGSRVMLMESVLQVEGVNSVMIDRYGAAYLAGAMVSDYPALILAAAPGVPTLDMAISGFRDGHERNFPNSSDESLLELQYLADNESGFAKPEEAYGLLYDYIYEREMNLLFDLAIFPLLGGSNIGAVRAVNDLNWSNAMLIGMDTDMAGASPHIPFSVVIRIDEVVYAFLADWLSGKEWPASSLLGMKDGVIDIVPSTTYVQRYHASEDDRMIDAARVAERCRLYRDEAIRKEAEYEQRLEK